MKLARVNPAWTFEGSLYFGCRHPHPPLECGAAKRIARRQVPFVQLNLTDIQEARPLPLHALEGQVAG